MCFTLESDIMATQVTGRASSLECASMRVAVEQMLRMLHPSHGFFLGLVDLPVEVCLVIIFCHLGR